MENNVYKIKIAHIILVHQLPEQLKKLVFQLYHEDVGFFIHVDKKVDQRGFETAIIKYPNLRFIKNRKNVTWGGFSLIEAVLEAMKEVIDAGGYTHVNLISGSDYPLTSPQEFIDFINQNSKKEFFEFYPIETEWKEAIPRYTEYHFTDFNFKGKYILQKLANYFLPKRRFPDEMILVGKSVWCTITIELVEYLLETFKRKKYLSRFLKLTWGIDEVIFPTLAYNSSFKINMVNKSLRYVNFLEGQAHPKILDITDLKYLYSQKYFFARKFHPVDSENLIIEIDKRI